MGKGKSASGQVKQFVGKAAGGNTDSFLESVEKQMKDIRKASGQTSNEEVNAGNTALSDYVPYTYTPSALRILVAHSTILPQCVRAYKDNIVGFGYQIERWNNKDKESPAQKTEKEKLDEIVEFFSLDMPLKKMLGKILEDREALGVGYMEVLRDGTGLPSQGFYVDAETVEATKLSEPIEIEILRQGKPFKYKKRFRKYRQRNTYASAGAYTCVYFKEFGDPRHMNYKTGEYVKAGETISDELEANEILPFVLGTGVYGTPRWIGQSIHIEGSRMAENLNYNYFLQGRHVNAMIVVEGGTLTAESYTNLQTYMDGVTGVDNAHKMLLLEIDTLMGEDDELLDSATKTNKPTVKIEKLNDLLQKDALFLEYTDASRKKVQSAFNLPDLYVGYTSDFNRATAEAAIEVTERQVFVPEREDIDWTFNNLLLAPYGFKEVYLKWQGPTTTDPEQQVAIFNAAYTAGGITPADARKFAGKAFDLEMEVFTDDWANIPIPVQTLKNQTAQTTPGSNVASNILGTGTLTDTTTGQSSEVVAVPGEVLKSLKTADEFIGFLKEIKKELQRQKEVN